MDSWHWQWCCACSYPVAWLSLLCKFYECSTGKDSCNGSYTWVNFTILPQNVLQAPHSLNWHRKDSHAIVVPEQFAKTAILLILWGFHPYNYFLSMFFCYLLVLFFGGGENFASCERMWVYALFGQSALSSPLKHKHWNNEYCFLFLGV